MSDTKRLHFHSKYIANAVDSMYAIVEKAGPQVTAEQMQNYLDLLVIYTTVKQTAILNDIYNLLKPVMKWVDRMRGSMFRR